MSDRNEGYWYIQAVVGLGALFRLHLYANYRGREPTILHQLEVKRRGGREGHRKGTT
jgi:hypothetical protein